jgi:hypothetical protein
VILSAQPGVNLNQSRKAKMIEPFLSGALVRMSHGLRVPDIGCGSRDIAAYFSRENSAVGVDVALLVPQPMLFIAARRV